jgi:uncharacterized DUF497 family protein
MQFEWDRGKAEANRRKHRVSFEDAVSVFFDPLSMTIPDPDHSAGEARFLTLGRSSNGRLLVVSHTDDGPTVRMISARIASAAERKRYET